MCWQVTCTFSSRIIHPHIGHVRRLSFCVVRHQRSSRLTSGRPTAPTSTLLTTAFGAVYSSVCVPEAGERCGWTEAALGGGLVWPTSDRCRWRNRRIEKTSPGLCTSKETALWTSAVTSDYDVANQQFVQLQTLAFNDFVTDVVGSLEYCSAVASTAGATGKPQMVLCS